MLQDQSDKDRKNDKTTKHHMTASLISVDYLRNGVMQGNKQQTDDKVSDVLDRFAKLHNDKILKRKWRAERQIHR